MQVIVELDIPTRNLEAPPEAPPRPFTHADRTDYSAGELTPRLLAILVSLIVHTAILLLLAVASLSGDIGSPVECNFEATFSRDDPPAFNFTEIVVAASDLSSAPVSAPAIDDVSQTQPQTLSNMPAIGQLMSSESLADEPASRESEFEKLLNATAGRMAVSFTVSGIDGRTQAARRALALVRGGTMESERAVELALEWLAAHQLPNGSWSLVHNAGACNGQCANPGSRERFEPAATGLALLAFLGAGYTHRDGKYEKQVTAGIYFLLQVMQDTPQGGSFLHGCDRGMYNHGIAAFALCEAYQMTDDEDLRQPAQLAVNFIANAQNQMGGWGYLPKQPGDLTLSGWQVMALKSAYAAGLYVRTDVIARIDKFLDSQTSQEKVFYGYAKPGKSPTCTAIGVLLRLFRNWSNTDPRVMQGIGYLTSIGVSSNDAYYNYYVTLLLHHTGGHSWTQWNARMRDYLVTTQRTTGHEAGSWYFENAFGKEGGRLYTTAMCAMTLEVYYRFAPLYLQSDKKFEL